MIGADAERRPRERLAFAAIVVASLVVLIGAVGTGQHVRATAGVLALVVLVTVFYERLVSLPALLVLTVLTILFVPIRRYSIPGSLPFHLEPYRMLVAFVIAAWILALLIDRRVRLRATGLEAPIFCYLGAVVLSLVANPTRVEAVGSFTWKSVSFLLSYVFVFYVFVSVLRSAKDIDFFVRLLVAGGGVLGFFALFESVTHVDVFNHLSEVVPVLHYDGTQAPETARGGGLRVYGSAQHPLALGAALALLIPLAVYCAQRTRQWCWHVAGVLMLLGIFATRSRTGIIMLLVIAIVYLVLRGRETRRFWPALVPLVLAIHFAVPGAIGTTWQSFFPEGGLLAQEKKNQVGSGRVATFGPVFHSEVTPNPILGEGYRDTSRGARGRREHSARAHHRRHVACRFSPRPGSWAPTCSAGSSYARHGDSEVRRNATDRREAGCSWAPLLRVVAYAIGMLTYDSFAFIQVTFLLFFVLAIGASCSTHQARGVGCIAHLTRTSDVAAEGSREPVAGAA